PKHSSQKLKGARDFPRAPPGRSAAAAADRDAALIAAIFGPADPAAIIVAAAVVMAPAIIAAAIPSAMLAAIHATVATVTPILRARRDRYGERAAAGRSRRNRRGIGGGGGPGHARDRKRSGGDQFLEVHVVSPLWLLTRKAPTIAMRFGRFA